MNNRVSLYLKHNKNRRWFTSDGIAVKGYLYASDGSYYQDSDLLTYFSKIDSEDVFAQKMKDANGLFSVVLHCNEELFVAVDRLRSFPLYFCSINNHLHLTDEVEELRDIVPFELSHESKRLFSHLGYTLENKTLIEGIFQIQAGEYIAFQAEEVRASFYHLHVNKDTYRSVAECKSQLRQIINNVGCRLVKQLNGRPVAIPLSGGYDSRLIAYMLHKHNYSNVLCFTYGKPTGNNELNNSQQIADRLGYEWLFVNYIQHADINYTSDPLFIDYCKYITQYSSCYFYQEFPAIQYLIHERKIDSDTVFLPGHSGDFIAGSHLRSFMKSRTTSVAVSRDLFNTHFKNKDISLDERKEFISLLSNQLNKMTSSISYRDFENWDLKERQAKYIVNSSKIWEYFGFRYLLPLWDNELTDFFSSMPFDYKLGKRLYDEVLKELFSEAGISFENDFCLSQAMNPRIDSIKNLVKNYFPFVQKKRNLWNFDSVGFEHMMQGLMAELKKNQLDRTVRSYNGASFAWYLLFVESQLINDEKSTPKI